MVGQTSLNFVVDEGWTTFWQPYACPGAGGRLGESNHRSSSRKEVRTHLLFAPTFLDKIYDVSALSDVIIKSNQNRIWMFYTEIQETLCLTCNIFKYVPFLWPTVFFPCIYRTFIFCFRLLDNDVREHKVAREKGKKCVPRCISTQHRSSQDNAQPGSKITKTFMNNTFSINSTLLKQRQVKTAWKVDFSVS